MQSTSKNRLWKWLVEHVDHFCISVVVSIAVSVASNPALCHMGYILRLIHIPARIIAWMGY